MVFRSSGEVTVTSCTVLVFIVNSFQSHFFQILDVIWTLFYCTECEFRGGSARVNPDHPPGGAKRLGFALVMGVNQKSTVSITPPIAMSNPNICFLGWPNNFYFILLFTFFRILHNQLNNLSLRNHSIRFVRSRNDIPLPETWRRIV